MLVTLYAWKKMFMSSDKSNSTADEKTENDKLKRENEALKKVVADLGGDKKPTKSQKTNHTSLVAVAKEVIATSKYTKTAVTRVLGISRASIYKKAKVLQMTFYEKREDEIYLPIIRLTTDSRPTYG